MKFEGGFSLVSRKSSVVIGVSTIAALIFATGADFAARPIPTVFNLTIVQAMDAITGHTTLALNAPTLLPHRSSGYLTATTAALPDAYQVTVWDTRRPLHVNNAAIVSERLAGGSMARFGAVRLSHPMPPQGAPNYLTSLERHNSVWTSGPATQESGTVNLGDGIQAVRYQHGSQTQLDWSEGDWTLQVAGRSLKMVKQAAVPVVHLLNTYYLPPYPGIYAVRLHGGGRTAITSIDWMRGRVLSWVSNQHASATNPVATGRMAISWKAYSVLPSGGLGRLRAFYTPTRPETGQTVTIRGQAWTPSGQPARYAHLAIEGIPGPSNSQLITTNAQGDFHLTHVWKHAGTYRINLGQGPIGEVLTIVIRNS